MLTGIIKNLFLFPPFKVLSYLYNFKFVVSIP